MTCTPANIYGPFRQHLFMGLSVSSFSTSLDLSGNNTEMTIRLVEDTCTSVEGKIYYDENLNRHDKIVSDEGYDAETNGVWYDADPGFTYPEIGSPCYFRIEDFEYSGLLQSYEESKSESGTTFVIKLVSPNEILQGANVILEDYAGSVGGLPNVFNVFGYAEKNGSTGVVCPQVEIGGVDFGSPAGKFGGAQLNNNGLPTAHIKHAIHILCSSIPATAETAYSTYGRLIFKGSNLDDDGFGVIKSDTTVSGVYKSLYLLDAYELPVPSDIWQARLSGIMSINDIINEICSDAGFDWYCELLPTSITVGESTDVYKIIKIRVIDRGSQPSLGNIVGFLSNFDSGNAVANSRSVGVELRNEPTSALIIGGQKESIYQSTNPDANDNFNILPYWGLDVDGSCIETRRLEFTNVDVVGGNKFVDGIFVNIAKLNISLKQPLTFPESGYVFLTINEIRAAAKSPESWRTWIQSVDKYVYGDVVSMSPDNELEEFETFGHLLAGRIRAEFNFNLDVAKDVLAGDKFPINAFIQMARFDAEQEVNDTSDLIKDLDTIYNFVSEYASYYGTKFMVKMPYDMDTGNSITAVKKIADVDTIVTSEEPCESGWPEYNDGEASDILGLPFPSDTFLFTNEQNKITPFVFFTLTAGPVLPGGDVVAKDFTETNEPDAWYYYSNKMYIKADVEVGHFVYDDASTYHSPRAVFSIDKPVRETTESGKSRSTGRMLSELINNLADLLGDPVDGEAFVDAVKNDVNFVNANTIQLDARAFIPDGVAIPIKSNVVTYGPWTSDTPGPVGQTRVERIDGLVPWEYGSITNMNQAGQYTADISITNMQAAEKGSITVPGFPSRPIGAEIQSNATFLFEDRTALNRGGSLNSNEYYQINNVNAWTGSGGPNITNISCEVGSDGATTSYEFRTYTPKFNRFGKLTLERFQKAGQRILRINKQLRISENQRILSLHKIANRNARLKAKEVAAKGVEKPESPHTVFVGQTLSKTEFGISQSITEIGLAKPTELNSEVSDNFHRKAIMSLDGLLRPAQRSGHGNKLPAYAIPTDTSRNLQAHTNTFEPPIENYAYPRVDTPFLDPFVDEGVGAANRVVGATNHDIQILGYNNSPPDASDGTDSIVLPMAQKLGTDHYADENNYRFMALRGPMVLSGWGYDIQGKPVPNAQDTDAINGNFETTDLKDKFLPEFLEKPETWPVAPIDLRYDRLRGVWTIPSGPRIVRARIETDLTNENRSSLAQILQSDGNPIYDADGNAVAEKIITVYIPFINDDEPPLINSGLVEPAIYAKADEVVVAYYNDVEGKYYALSHGGSATGQCVKVYTDIICNSGSGIEAHWQEIYVPLCSSSGVDTLCLPTGTGCCNENKEYLQFISDIYEEDECIKAKIRTILVEAEDDEAEFTVSCLDHIPYHVTFELMEDITGDTCADSGVWARIDCDTAKTPIVFDYARVRNTVPLFEEAKAGCKGIAVLDRSWTNTGSETTVFTIDEIDYTGNNNYKFKIVESEIPVCFGYSLLDGNLCPTDLTAVLQQAEFIPVKTGRNRFVPVSSTEYPTEAQNRFGHAGVNDDIVYIIRDGADFSSDWTIIDIKKSSKTVVISTSENSGIDSDCSINVQTQSFAMETCAAPGANTKTSINIPEFTFRIYDSRCNTETGVMEKYYADVTVNACAGTSDVSTWLICSGSGDCPE